MESITTTIRGRQLLRDGYLYYKNKSLNNGSSYWECKKRRSGNRCKVKIVLDEQENFSHQFGQHTHTPNPEAVSSLKLRSKIKRDARYTDTLCTTTNNIITTNIGEMHEEVLAKLPCIDTIRRDVREQRTVNQSYPELPENTLFEIPHPYNVNSYNIKFKNDKNANIKMISALSFVLIADTIQAFDALSNHAGVEEQAVLDYFETNYMANFDVKDV